MTISIACLLINLITSWFMTGLIWFVQIVHYPQFCDVGSDAFAGYHRRHTRLVTFVVAGPMLVEALAAVGFLFWHPPTVPLWIPIAGLALVLILWLSTALLQVPRHNLLATAYSALASRQLVATNWVRTIGWSARGVFMLYALKLVLSLI